MAGLDPDEMAQLGTLLRKLGRGAADEPAEAPPAEAPLVAEEAPHHFTA
jgi:hypothetical protein